MFENYKDLPKKFELDISEMVIPATVPEDEKEFWKSAPKILAIEQNENYGLFGYHQFQLNEKETDPEVVQQARELSRMRYIRNYGFEPPKSYLQNPLGFSVIPEGAKLVTAARKLGNGVVTVTGDDLLDAC